MPACRERLTQCHPKLLLQRGRASKQLPAGPPTTPRSENELTKLTPEVR